MRGCLTCRLRHLKCDKSGSKCLRCQRSGRECLPAPGKSEEVSFRHGQNPSLRGKGPPRYGESDLAFPDDQVWVETSSPDLDFKDETDQTAAEYYVVPILRRASPARSSSEDSLTPSSSTMESSLTSHLAIPAYGRSQLGSSSNSVNSPHAPTTPTPTPVSHPRLSNVTEAFLLRHFQKHLAPWLDACDPNRHFSTYVVERATRSPLLLYACLAVSACHLSRTTNTISCEVAHAYHERCISIMLPVLDKPEFEIGIEILLSSTVILRFFESISSHSPPNDPQHHLLAGSVYISSHVESAISPGLASASFWMFVIQDIQFALTYQKCLRLSFAPIDDRLRHWWISKPVLSDGDWTHRAVWILAETVEICYNSRRDDVEKEIALRNRIKEWELGRPDTFTPLHVSPPDHGAGKPFPVVWFMSLWHATAIQHICLAKAMLLIRELEVYDRSIIHREQPAKLRDLTETLNFMFGVAISADDDPSLRTTACHVLFICSSWIEAPVVQNLLVDLLRRTERENGWPWGYVRNQVLQAWRPM
ncbi:hypothetical protein N7535_009498 [Penicillium sp. DV-2018c]|nr:hypothetical protein N7535_009498 [Penicillium sp. DV-2018c]